MFPEKHIFLKVFEGKSSQVSQVVCFDTTARDQSLTL